MGWTTDSGEEGGGGSEGKNGGSAGTRGTGAAAKAAPKAQPAARNRRSAGRWCLLAKASLSLAASRSITFVPAVLRCK